MSAVTDFKNNIVNECEDVLTIYPFRGTKDEFVCSFKRDGKLITCINKYGTFRARSVVKIVEQIIAASE